MTDPSFTIFETAIGSCGVAWGERGIVAVQLPMSSAEKTRQRLHQRCGDIREGPPPAPVQHAIDGMTELLAGKPNDLSDVVLDLAGVPEFNRKVYDMARKIPPGKTLSYGDIARRLGGVELSRDVGQALGHNPCPVVVPCHRVPRSLVPGPRRRAMSVRRWRTIRSGSSSRAIACWPRAASRADFQPMAASPPS